MDPQELERFLRKANKVIQSGKATRAQVDAAFQRKLGMSFSDAAAQVREAGISRQEQARAENQATIERAEAKDQPLGQLVGDVVTTAANSRLFNFLDDLAGVANVLRPQGVGRKPIREEFEEGRQAVLGREARLQELNPGSALLANLAGGLAGPGIGTLNVVRRSPGIVARSANAALAGGLTGGLSAAGAGGDMQDVKRATVGGVLLGGALPAVPRSAAGLLPLPGGRIGSMVRGLFSRAADRTSNILLGGSASLAPEAIEELIAQQ